MTKEAYREELAAAHARIAELEDRLAEKTATMDPKIRSLEERRARVARTSEPRYLRKFALVVTGALTLVFGVIGLVAWAATGALPSEAGMVGGIGGLGLFIGLVIGLLHLFITPVAAKRQLEHIDQQIAEALRIAKLESDVAEMRRVRVGSEPLADVEEAREEEIEEPNRGRS
jgi:hypothetical protein